MHTFAETAESKPRVRRSLSVLDTVQIARPCPADWEGMRPVAGQARERVRHCEDCRLRVYNLSSLKRADAEALLQSSEGRLCIRLYRRDDGTVLTADCSYIRRFVEKSSAGARRLAWIAACGMAAVLGSAVYAGALLRHDPSGGAGGGGFVQRGFDAIAQIHPIDRFMEWLRPQPSVPMMGGAPAGQWLAGDMSAPELVQWNVPPQPPMPSGAPERWLSPDDPPPL